MDFYITLRSNDSLDFYPENNSFYFRVELNAPIQFDHRWKVGLCDVRVDSAKEGDLYICSSVCEESQVGSGMLPLLRRMYCTNDDIEKDFLKVHYIPLRVKELKTLDIYIKDSQGHLASFISETSVLTLHFKRQSYIL